MRMSRVASVETPDVWDGVPDYVREAYRWYGKAVVAQRIYRRRGWNTRSVDYSVERARERVQAAQDRWRHAEDNPTLF